MKKNRNNLSAEIENERKFIISKRKDFYLTEAYKSLRTNVLFSLTGDGEGKMLMITSSEQGEGKSITAVNLAISFAQDEKKVLLIDCDLRRPKIARLLELSAECGLSNILMKPELRKDAILRGPEKNLDVLTAGDIPPNPSELLGSKRMEALLKDLCDQYDYILLDTPPINLVTDGMVLSTRVDGTLFVVRAGKAERGAVLRAMDMLGRANAKVLGFVFNGAEQTDSRYGGKKYRYGKYGKYGKYSNYDKYNYGYGYDTGYGFSSGHGGSQKEVTKQDK